MRLKKLLAPVIIGLGVLAFASCDSEKVIQGETVVINSLNADKEKISLTVKKSPERIAVLDMASLDIIDALDEGDKVVGCATTSIEYLSDYSPENNDNIINIGTVKVADLEAVVECEPDVIFIGGRLSASYNELSKIAPTVYLATDSLLGVVESTREVASEIAKIFGKESVIDSLVDSYNARIETIKEFSKNKTALVSLVSGTSANVLTNSGRCSIIGVECGFTNVGNQAADSTHGDAVSFEYFVEQNPDYIFVMDRNSVTGDTNNAKDIIENAVVKESDAYKNGNIVYLANSNVWYTAEGGISALGTMLSDLELGLGLNK